MQRRGVDDGAINPGAIEGAEVLDENTGGVTQDLGMAATGTMRGVLFMRSGAVASLLGIRKTRVVSFCSTLAMVTP